MYVTKIIINGGGKELFEGGGYEWWIKGLKVALNSFFENGIITIIY